MGLGTDIEAEKPIPFVRGSAFPTGSFGPLDSPHPMRSLMFDPARFGPMRTAMPVLIARDLRRNLAAALSWLILTDGNRQVTAEGLALDELDGKQ